MAPYGQLRVLVINPLDAWWCYKFSAEAALRFRNEGADVHWWDATPEDPQSFHVNASDVYPRWRYQRPDSNVRGRLSGQGVAIVDSPRSSPTLGDAIDFGSAEQLRDWQRAGLPVGRVLAASVAGRLQQRDFDIVANRQVILDHLAEIPGLLSDLRHVFDSVQPDLVVTTNDRLFVAGMALLVAQDQGLPTKVAYFGSTADSYAIYDGSLYSPDSWRHNVDDLWASRGPTESQRAELEAEVSALGVLGHPAAYAFRSQMTPGMLPPLDPGRKVFAFFAGTPWEYSGLIDRGEGVFDNQVEAVNAVLRHLDPSEWTVVVRHHPPRHGRPPQAEFGLWDGARSFAHLVEVAPDSSYDSYALARRADVVGVWNSTIGLECLAAGHQVAVFGDPYWLQPSWGVTVASPSDLSRVLGSIPRITLPDDLLPFHWYEKTHGSQCAYATGTDQTTLAIAGRPVFAPTAMGHFITRLGRSLPRRVKDMLRRFINV